MGGVPALINGQMAVTKCVIHRLNEIWAMHPPSSIGSVVTKWAGVT
jgi:hypothetical protein